MISEGRDRSEPLDDEMNGENRSNDGDFFLREAFRVLLCCFNH